LGRGILRISWKNFADELLTFSGIGESSLIRTSSAAGFLSYFTERLAGSFLAPLNMSHYPEPMTTKGYYAKQPPTTSVTLTASDGIKTTMQIWVPQQGSQNKPILLVPGASVDHQIFALPTIPFNFVDFLLEKGYTVYCVTHRVGKTPVAKANWTTYDARLDIAAATTYILKAEKVEKIYAVVHCAGSVATAMGLLDGTIKGIGGLTASNVFMGPMFAKVNLWKASIVPSMATTYKKLIGPWYECVDDKKDTVFQKILNEALHAYPVGEMKEVCDSVVCHRSELVFGKYVYFLL
jgi:hypothetical protein